jgi:deoxyribodipyrimidine photolyase-related protein
MTPTLRHLVLILGDQLDEEASALRDFDPQRDAIWMAEVDEESTHVTSSKQRTTVFLSAMRHFAARLRARGWPVHYTALDAPNNAGTLAGELDKTLQQTHPEQLVIDRPRGLARTAQFARRGAPT